MPCPKNPSSEFHGGYLDFLQRSFGSPRLDYGCMANAICGHFGWTLLRCVYSFNCLPYLSNSPTPEEQEAFRKKEGCFYQRLQKLDRFEVKLGRLVLQGIGRAGPLGKPVPRGRSRWTSSSPIEMVYAAARRSVDNIILL